ncbi:MULTISPECIES: hypothetical protein [Tsukamurella]|uniref:DUF4333 domain-containing protein n=1 Tax=Tsukamurella strandjordii TaxID=147577 RepID=A0AA90N948_9ACTN|nr:MULTISPECIES: hypothetical protein [Tsukamurella]MDP0397165.1 hypothetical protein [Tsukamurella strandjordii]
MRRALLAIAAAAAVVVTATPADAEPAIDADRYRTDGGDYAFQYRYEGANRNCTVSAEPTTVRCVIAPPAGTRITVGRRVVRPNAIEITERGWRYLEDRTPQEKLRALPEGARLSVLGASCTAIRGGGIECTLNGVGFRQASGTFAPQGKRAR